MSQELMRVDTGGGRERLKPVEYPSNSRKSREKKPDPPEKKVEQIVTGNVIQRKKGLSRKIRDAFLQESDESIMSFIAMEVLIPAAKNMISDTFSQGIDRLLFGEVRVRSRADRPGGFISYNTVRRQPVEYGKISPKGRAQHDFGEVIIPSRGEAMDVLDKMKNLIEVYGVVTVEDYYDLLGITGEFTDIDWGWYNLDRAMVRNVRGGYIIALPRTQSID